MSLPSISDSTIAYEGWLRGEVHNVIPRHLTKKREKMADKPFPFLRATFYRWAELFPEKCPMEASATLVLGVGDLHVENFGTWRDAEGRLVWGVNDFDEACTLPFTSDLIRLATSALLAAEKESLPVQPVQVCDLLIEGYRNGLTQEGRPFVLDDDHNWLHDLAMTNLQHWEKFWDGMDDDLQKDPLSTSNLSLVGATAIAALPPVGGAKPPRLALREAGVGSLGRERVLAVTKWGGGKVAREAKELAPSAWHWRHSGGDKVGICYTRILQRAVRCLDPFQQVRGTIVERRLAPDSDKLSLSEIRRAKPEGETAEQAAKRETRAEENAEQMLRAMGFETANIHLASSGEAVAQLLQDSRLDNSDWLEDAAHRMLEQTEADFHEWKSWYEAHPNAPLG